MRAILSVIAVSALTVACGNSEPPPVTPANPPPPAAAEAKGAGAAGHVEGHEGGHEDHGKMKPALHDFHEVLAPIWHSTPGSERVGKACGGLNDLNAKAAAVADAELTANVEAVKTACGTPTKADVEPKLSAVHDRFHKLAEAK